MTSSTRRFGLPRSRRAALFAALWLFGLFTTVLLAGVWGRSVASDPNALRAGADAVLESDAVSDRVLEWMESGIAEASGLGLPHHVAADAATAVWNHPETRAALASLIDDFVAAALDPDGGRVVVDLSASLDPLVPVVEDEFLVRGIPVEGDLVGRLLGELPDIVLSSETGGGIGRAVAAARAMLTRVVLVGLAGMALTGVTALVLAEEPMRQMGGLATRVAASAVSFAVLLRLGAWALDPGGGRSPVAKGGSAVLSAGSAVLLSTALASAVVAVAAVLIVRRRGRPSPV